MRNTLLLTTSMTLLAACAGELEQDEAGFGPDAGMTDPGPTDTGTSDPGDAAFTPAPALPAGCPSVNVKTTAGAKGDGVTNDTAAFKRAAALIQAKGCGELIIPPATYIVGRQTTKTQPTQAGPFYAADEIFSVHDLTYLHIYAYGATVRVAPGLRYGGFSRSTGLPVDVTGGTKYLDDRAEVGRVIEVSTSDNVFVEGGEFDGNNTHLVLGGQWGNVDRQVPATGLTFDRCLSVVVRDVYTHHHGLDGITVSHRKEVAAFKKPHRLFRVRSEYNGRQGLSWIGGWGLEINDSEFSHTGRAINVGGGRDSGQPMMSMPRAGVDIEPNGGTIEQSRDGVFRRTNFIDNAGAGILADAGDGGYSTFDDCTFWGTTSYSAWARKPGMKFYNSRFYGTAVHTSDGHSDADPTTPVPALATYFENCTFEDKPWTDGTVKRQGSLFNIGSSEGDGVTFKNCTFRNHQVKAIDAAGPTTRERFDTCTFMTDNATLANNDSQARFSGSEMTSVWFRQSTAIANGTRDYAINVENVLVKAPAAGAPGTRVDAPHLHWDTASGTTGTITPGTY